MDRTKETKKPLLNLGRLKAKGLEIEELTLFPGEALAVLGETGAGMDVLEAILAGGLDLVRSGECVLPQPLGLVSFARQQALFERELRNDDTDFINKPDPGTPARAFLRNPDAYHDFIRLLALEQVLDRGYRYLSSGESMKLHILSELSSGARLLVLEHPFDGLDAASREELRAALCRLNEGGLTLLLLLGDADDLPTCCNRLALLQNGAIRKTGTREELLPLAAVAQAGQNRERAIFRAQVADIADIADSADSAGPQNEAEANGALIALKNGFARYGEVEVFSGLDLIIRPGEHTLITGPNGCGKSTLVQLITGDHPLCYQNDLCILGQRRGSGETIWDVKRHMGIVSGDLHRSHRISGSTLSVVLSGLFDSIGLYHRPTREERALGEKWLSWIKLSDSSATPFRRLSYGEQRLVMLARALIKKPQILLMDEPTQGLDRANRDALLDFLTQASAAKLSTIIYISHREDEYRPFFRQHLAFRPEPGVAFRVGRN